MLEPHEVPEWLEKGYLDRWISSVPVASSEEITVEVGREMLRREVSDKLGISLDQFFSNVDAGEYDSSHDDTVGRLLMLLPFAR